MSLTTDKNDPGLNKTQENGQNESYLILSEEERAKGFIRPVRDTYIHVGREIEKGIIIPLHEALENMSEYAKGFYTQKNGYVAYLKYPESESPVDGKFIRGEEYDAIKNQEPFVGGCYGITTMSREIAETYAKDPKFYGATFCSTCKKHISVDEFVWKGTNEKVGS